ncbi:hypothetical protein LTR94_036917, partial [Friedmanniomyces endolithicus]
ACRCPAPWPPNRTARPCSTRPAAPSRNCWCAMATWSRRARCCSSWSRPSSMPRWDRPKPASPRRAPTCSWPGPPTSATSSWWRRTS